MRERPYAPIAYAALTQTPILERLAITSAVVLERIARGAGATNWYWCASEDALKKLAERFAPGSKVSFYFDKRLQTANYAEAKSEILRIAANTGDCVVGILSDDGMKLDVQLIASHDELAEEESVFAAAPNVIY